MPPFTDGTPSWTKPNHPHWPYSAIRLPTATYYQVLHTLRGYLPPPITDTPQDHTRRDDAAIAQVAAMLPVNADEAHLAAQCVGARAQATDCLRLARVHEADVTRSLQCTAQAARMMREANGSRTLLLLRAGRAPAARGRQCRRRYRRLDRALRDRLDDPGGDRRHARADAAASAPSPTVGRR